MPKVDMKEVDRMNAFCEGEEDYPALDKCPYDFAKKPHAHTAYWDGWNAAAIEADRAENSAGT